MEELKSTILRIKKERKINGKAHKQLDDEYCTLIHIVSCIGGKMVKRGEISKEDIEKLLLPENIEWLER